MDSLKAGRVVVILAGRRAGKKAVIVNLVDQASKKGRKYPHCLVAGLERYPRKVTRRMGAKKVAQRCKLRPFVKYINYTHMLPTRYDPSPSVGTFSALNSTSRPSSMKKDSSTARPHPLGTPRVART